MSFLGLVVVVAAAVPLVTGGSYRRLADAPWRWAALLALGLGLQLLLDTGLVPRSSWHNVGFGILVASYVVLLGFCAGNMIVRGMAVVLIGVALNAFVITIDQGMPVHVPPDWQRGQNHVSATIKHHPRVHGDHLLALTDIIVLRRLDAIISFGDLIIAFGLVDVSYWASRRSRARSRGRDGPGGEPRSTDAAGAEVAGGQPASVPVREKVGAGAGRGSARSARSAPPHPTVAIQDALERLERS